MTRTVVVTADVLGARMAGPAIRALNIATMLSAANAVQLVSTTACDIDVPGVECRAVNSRQLREIAAHADVVVLQGYVTARAPWLLRGDHVVVVDLYDPLHLEKLEELGDRPAAERRATLDLAVRVLNEQIVHGDFFLCASEAQRHLWLGHLGAFGRINPLTYGADVTLRSLIDVCPFGMPDQPPERTRAAIKGTIPGIGPDDKVILWAGGIYDWFDPLTLIRAVGRLAETRPDVRLLFLGTTHPTIGEPRMAQRARALSDELALTDRFVFFNQGWAGYEDRQNFLLDADVGVSTHVDHIETAFAFRTRLLDYLWASVPIVTTEGDSFARVVERDGLGRTVPERDVDALARALAEMLDDESARTARRNIGRVRDRYTWSAALGPLVRYCSVGARAADAGPGTARISRHPLLPRHALPRELARAADLARHGGMRAVARTARRLMEDRRRSGGI